MGDYDKGLRRARSRGAIEKNSEKKTGFVSPTFSLYPWLAVSPVSTLEPQPSVTFFLPFCL